MRVSSRGGGPPQVAGEFDGGLTGPVRVRVDPLHAACPAGTAAGWHAPPDAPEGLHPAENVAFWRTAEGFAPPAPPAPARSGRRAGVRRVIPFVTPTAPTCPVRPLRHGSTRPRGAAPATATRHPDIAPARRGRSRDGAPSLPPPPRGRGDATPGVYCGPPDGKPLRPRSLPRAGTRGGRLPAREGVEASTGAAAPFRRSPAVPRGGGVHGRASVVDRQSLTLASRSLPGFRPSLVVPKRARLVAK